MPGLRRLPRHGHWEVDLIETPEIQVQDVEMRGTLIIADRDTGMVIGAFPLQVGEDVDLHVLRAATDPVPPNAPSRPRSILCRMALRGELFDAARAMGTKLKVTEHLPAIEALSESLRASFAEDPPLLPIDPEPWRAVVADFVRAQPWRLLDDTICFHYPSGSALLEDAIGQVIGMAGEQIGFTLYPTTSDHDKFMAAAYNHRMDGLGDDVEVWCAHLEPVDNLPPGHVHLAEHLGLVHGDLALQLFVLKPPEFRQLEPHEEVAFLAAFQGMLGAWHDHGADLLQKWPRTPVETVAGTLTVAVTPSEMFDDPASLILTTDHKIIFTDTLVHGCLTPTLVLKMAKRDAQRLAKEIAGIDALSLVSDGDTFDVVAWCGPSCLGVLTRMPATLEPWEPWQEDGGALIISAGGAKRRKLREQDIVFRALVDLYDDDDDISADDEGLSTPDSLKDASWDGPPEEWPKASAVLLAYAAPLHIAEMEAEQFEQAVTVAATIWTSVVHADESGNMEFLDEVRKQTNGTEIEGMVDFLIERKRKTFPQDRRLLMIQKFTRSPGHVNVDVAWTMP